MAKKTIIFDDRKQEDAIKAAIKEGRERAAKKAAPAKKTVKPAKKKAAPKKKRG